MNRSSQVQIVFVCGKRSDSQLDPHSCLHVQHKRGCMSCNVGVCLATFLTVLIIPSSQLSPCPLPGRVKEENKEGFRGRLYLLCIAFCFKVEGSALPPSPLYFWIFSSCGGLAFGVFVLVCCMSVVPGKTRPVFWVEEPCSGVFKERHKTTCL